MNAGRPLAFIVTAMTGTLVFIGTLFPTSSAVASAGSGTALLRPPSSPEVAVETLAEQIGRKDWTAAYEGLTDKNEFTEQDFVHDLIGTHPSLRSYATLDGFDLHPLHVSADEARFRVNFRWSTVVGTLHDVRDLRATRVGNQWQVAWPLVKEPKVPPQVIAVNYLRWDVVYRGPEDDWGAQDVESPHVRIVDMHPFERGGEVVLLGELLNEDVVPAFVTVKATLLAKNGAAIATEDAFDKMSHVLLPKQVTPFRIDFQNARLSDVDNIRMDPSSSLVAASADPVVEIEDQKLNGLPEPSLTGKLVNQSGQIVNIAHVLSTFYDSTGQPVWVSDGYADRALLPETPVPFATSLPSDLSNRVSSYRVVASTYSSSRFQ
ncbi:MAG TPA: hypothetical protein VNY51_05490 [Candidatus Dormibacteraeota bacterium]|jgi:hypothetical protein|nr:hypothetical protein [Candidatus Dormibacteraeota bacterium]